MRVFRLKIFIVEEPYIVDANEYAFYYPHLPKNFDEEWWKLLCSVVTQQALNRPDPDAESFEDFLVRRFQELGWKEVVYAGYHSIEHPN